MFDEKLYLEICKEYGIEQSESGEIEIDGKIVQKEELFNLLFNLKNN